MEAQSRLIDALDTKAAVLLAVDGVLAGLLFDHGADAAPAPRLLLTVMFLSLFSSFVLALASFWVRQYATAPVLGSVVRFMERDREWLKWRSLGNLQQAYQANERKPQRKARPIAWVSLPLPDEGQQRRVDSRVYICLNSCVTSHTKVPIGRFSGLKMRRTNCRWSARRGFGCSTWSVREASDAPGTQAPTRDARV